MSMTMILAVLQFFHLVLLANGMSLEGAMNVSECLKTCEEESDCPEDCNLSAGPLDSNFPKVNGSAGASVILHCRTSRVLVMKHNPGDFIVEQSATNDEWGNTKVFNGEFTTFDNLTADTFYRFRFYRLTTEGVTQPEISEWYKTYAEDYTPCEVVNASLDWIRPLYELGYPLYTQIRFEPGEDRSCDYQIRTWDGELDLYHFSLPRALNFTFHTVARYETTYEVLIFAENGDRVGQEMGFNVTIPGCYELHGPDSDLCAPSPVEELQAHDVALDGSAHDLVLTWKAPARAPENYTIEIYLPQSSGHDGPSRDTFEFIRTEVVPGNVTRALISSITLRVPYMVTIYAESNRGQSATTTIVKTEFDRVSESAKVYGELIGISTALGLAILFIGLLYACICKGRNKAFNTRYTHFRRNVVADTIKSPEIDNCENASRDVLASHDKFEFCPSRLQVKGIIGNGAYGIVKLGNLRDNSGKLLDVAVKTVKDNPSKQDIKNLYREIQIMKCADRHTNIVSLIGYCTMDRKPVLIMEYCSLGDLQSYLRKIWENVMNVTSDYRCLFRFDRKPSVENITEYLNGVCPVKRATTSTKLTGKESGVSPGNISNCLYDMQQDLLESIDTVIDGDLLNFARQVAIGMEYLASKRIVHRDLAARNVLVCSGKIVKISDFGLSRDVYQEDMYKKQGNDKLPIKWMAIESLTHQIYTSRSDVWSFGILLWEIHTLGGTPYPGTPSNQILRLLKSGYRMERPSNCSTEVYDLMLSCWDVKPQCRPTFTELKSRLDAFLCEYFGNEYMTVIAESYKSTEYERLTQLK